MLLPEEQTTLTTVACIIGAYKMFIEAKVYNNEHKRKEVFSVELATPAGKFFPKFIDNLDDDVVNL
jgi:hypothetical protein